MTGGWCIQWLCAFCILVNKKRPRCGPHPLAPECRIYKPSQPRSGPSNYPGPSDRSTFPAPAVAWHHRPPSVRLICSACGPLSGKVAPAGVVTPLGIVSYLEVFALIKAAPVPHFFTIEMEGCTPTAPPHFCYHMHPHQLAIGAPRHDPRRDPRARHAHHSGARLRKVGHTRAPSAARSTSAGPASSPSQHPACPARPRTAQRSPPCTRLQ